MASRSALLALRTSLRSRAGQTSVGPTGAAAFAVRTIRTTPFLRAGNPSVPEASLPPFSEPVGINPAEKTAPLNSPLHEYGQYLTTCLPKHVQQFSVYKDELTLYVAPQSIIPTMTFLRDHTQCQYKAVMDITAVDYPTRANRFEVSLMYPRSDCSNPLWDRYLTLVDRVQHAFNRPSVANQGQDVRRRDQCSPVRHWIIQRRQLVRTRGMGHVRCIL